MNETLKHIHNISGSQLDVATIGAVMNVDAITYDTYEEDVLMKSPEIRRYINELKFVELLTDKQVEAFKKAKEAKVVAEAKAKTEESVDLEFFGSMETVKEVQRSIANLEAGLEAVKAVINGKKMPKTVGTRRKKKEVSAEESEKTQGSFATNESTEKSNDFATPELDDEDIPKTPPLGMTPMNDPSKTYLVSDPDKKIAYLNGCMDIGILREIAIFETDAKLKALATKKLGEAKRKAGI